MIGLNISVVVSQDSVKAEDAEVNKLKERINTQENDFDATTWSVIITAFGGLILFFSWLYHGEITKTLISLTDVKIEAKKIDGTVRIEFHFTLKTIGRHIAVINDISLFRIIPSTGKKKESTKELVMNEMLPESIHKFHFSLTIKLEGENLNASQQRIVSLLPGLVGEHFIIFYIRYKIKSKFSFGNKYLKMYFRYIGDGAMHQMLRQDYLKIKKDLPKKYLK